MAVPLPVALYMPYVSHITGHTIAELRGLAAPTARALIAYHEGRLRAERTNAEHPSGGGGASAPRSKPKWVSVR